MERHIFRDSPETSGNCAFPENLNTIKFGEIAVFYAVYGYWEVLNRRCVWNINSQYSHCCFCQKKRKKCERTKWMIHSNTDFLQWVALGPSSKFDSFQFELFVYWTSIETDMFLSETFFQTFFYYLFIFLLLLFFIQFFWKQICNLLFFSILWNIIYITFKKLSIICVIINACGCFTACLFISICTFLWKKDYYCTSCYLIFRFYFKSK